MVSFTRIAILSFCQQQSHLISRKSLNQRISPSSSSPLAFLFLTIAQTGAYINTSSSSSPSSSSLPSSSATQHRYITSIGRTTHCAASKEMFASPSDDDNIDTNISDMNDVINTGHLNAKDAYELDQQLFSTGYTLEQLMELAGLAVAEAIYDVSPPDQQLAQVDVEVDVEVDKKKKKVLLVCGPGNNGGDGLVAARHLVMFGYEAVVVYPKRSSREEHYSKLVKQCEDVGVEVLDALPDDDDGSRDYDIIVDAIFGFSFKGEAREPFGSIIKQMIEIQQSKKVPIFSVDVPSGWNVDEGDVANTGMVPDVLVSLTAPKLCSKEFMGRHFVGGRFLPPGIADKYGIQMPPYPGVRQVMEITSNRSQNENEHEHKNEDEDEDGDDWALQYASYCAEKEAKEQESNQMNKAEDQTDEEDWAVQYQNHCIEKEAQLKEKEEAEAENKFSNEKGWEKDYADYLNEKARSNNEKIE